MLFGELTLTLLDEAVSIADQNCRLYGLKKASPRDVNMVAFGLLAARKKASAKFKDKLTGLEQRRMEIEMSDDRAYSNGRMAKINDEIAAVRKTLAAAPEASHE